MSLERCDGCGRPGCQDLKFARFWRLNMLAVLRVDQVILAFDERSPGDIEKAGEVTIRPTTEAFGDVARRRRRGASELLTESDIPPDLWPFEESVHRHLELGGKPPAFEIDEARDSRHEFRSATRGPRARPSSPMALRSAARNICDQ